ncbi:MAG: FecCD family ABC transporter permease [Thermoguttaceae bacterium]
MTEERDVHFTAYERSLAKKRAVVFAVFLATIGVVLFSLSRGAIDISFKDVLTALFGAGDRRNVAVVWDIRLPRAFAALVVGATLAACGATMQCVLRNALASASTLGVSQGAAFGAALGIVVFGGGVVTSGASAVAMEIDNPYVVTFCAFVFGSTSAIVILLLSRFKQEMGPDSLILAGVALSSLFTGGFSLLQFFADETQLGAVVFWTFGNLGGADWSENAIMGVVFAATMIFLIANSWKYNALSHGVATAQGLGINANFTVLLSMTICSLAAAVCVSFVGIIGFVGLVAPHIMRKFVGDDYRFLTPASTIAGACLLIAADTFGRLIIAPVILPVGAVTSFLGAPVFLALLIKGKRRYD